MNILIKQASSRVV